MMTLFHHSPLSRCSFWAGMLMTLLAPSLVMASLLPKTVILKPNVVVAGEVVRLGDLFSGLEDNPNVAAIPVTSAPDLGQDLKLSANWLASVALRHNVAWQPRTSLDQAVVQRSSQVVGASEITPVIQQAIAGYGFSGEVQIHFDDQSPLMLLPSEIPLNLSLKGLHLDPASGRFSGQVVALGHDDPLRVSGRAHRMVEVPVLNRRLAPGEEISAQHIEWMKLRADQVNRDAITKSDDMIGMTPRRTLSAGQMVRVNQLQTPVVVRKNSLITIQLVSGQMALTVQGRALENGAQGDVIRVMNTNSRKVVNALVAAADRVEVKLPGANLAAVN
ncbi:MAG: flagellar basal body P-ring formation chaperone FlgA [Pseudomonadota bacterium]